MKFKYAVAEPRADRSQRLATWSDFPEEEFARSYIALGRRARMEYRLVAREIKQLVPQASAILDIASGPGYLPVALARRYPQAAVTGLDYSPTMVAHARELHASRGLSDSIRVVQGDAFKMPFAAESFDLAVNTSFLHQVDDLDRLCREARRVLRPKGAFVSMAWRRDAPEWLYRLAWLHTRYVHARGQALDGGGVLLDASWTESEVREALLEAGFLEVRVETGLVRLTALGLA